MQTTCPHLEAHVRAIFMQDHSVYGSLLVSLSVPQIRKSSCLPTSQTADSPGFAALLISRADRPYENADENFKLETQ